MQKQKDRIMDTLQLVLGIFVAAMFVFFILGEVLLPTENASKESKCREFKAEWVRVMPDGSRVDVTIPGDYAAAWNETVVIETNLPDDQEDTWFCIRSSQHDYYIYVGDELRQEYSTKESRPFGRNSADAYVFFQIYEEDAGKTFRIESISDSSYSGYLNSIYMGEKNAIWSMFFGMYMPGTVIAVLMVLLSALVVCVGALLQVFYKKKMDIIYFGIGMLLIAVWLIVESKLRQLILPNGSVATAVGFFVIMLLPYPFVTYMNRIQRRRYQTGYLAIIIFTTINCVVSTTLQLIGVKDFFETMGISHVILVLMMVFLVLTLIMDIRKGYIKEYPFVAAGFGGLVVAGVAEIYFVYEKASIYNGIPLSIGLIVLLFTVSIKTGRDLLKSEKEKHMAIVASESKAKFLANMSHEIRTPINTVIGMNEMILRENKDENIHEYAKNIKSASNMLLGLINDVLDFSKIEAGKLEVTENKYYLSSLLNDVILSAKVRAEKKSLEIKLDIDESMPAVLFGDDIRIKQVLNNLLSNAVKYTEKGSITFSAKGERSGDEFILVMAVRDTGMGIKEEDMQKLFGSFQRLELSKNRYIEGTGLGLTITKQLVEQMRGRIEVESEYGKGTCFKVHLPQKVIDATAMGDLKSAYKKAVGEKEENKGGLYAPNASVLVVDDNKMNLVVVQGLLKRTAIKLDFASGGNECIEKCKTKKYDLILMDHMMPEPDGVQTLHMLRDDRDGINKDTTVIVLTANAIAGVDEEYIKEGFADYLPKPIEVGRLESTLAKYLQG